MIFSSITSVNCLILSAFLAIVASIPMPAFADCNPVGGDCTAGTACYPTEPGVFICVNSDGINEGGDCDPNSNNWTTLPCADGLICLDVAGLGAGECRAFCTAQADCEGTDVCTIPVFADIDDLGACLPCTDADVDGACAEVDCDDLDNTSFPGATELCEDGRDNDCDGAADALDDDCDPGPDPDAGPDADVDDDAEPDADATLDPDADPDPGTKKADPACACRSAGGSAPDSLPASWPLFALALVVPALRRRASIHSKNGEAPRKEESC